MKVYEHIEPFEKELPSQFADRLGLYYTSLVDQEHKKVNGQFFTPIKIANLMASMVEFNTNHVQILDPGCGTGVLSCALIEKLVFDSKLVSINLCAYEMDLKIIPLVEASFEYLSKWLKVKNINFQYSLISNDFILENLNCFIENDDFNINDKLKFDIIISNPPYFKLSSNDRRVVAAKSIVNGHSNIYSIFMAISAKLLKENGELIFITPRSYASGYYFKSFREFFFQRIEIDKVHLFVSRKATFSRDKVLQETVILKGKKNSDFNPFHKVIVTSSNGLSDIDKPYLKEFEQKELIDLNTNGKILYLPTNDFEESILNIFRSWDYNLNKHNIQISTGPVVGFRSKEYIQDNFENGSVFLAPLFWLHNIKQMFLEWPLPKPEKGRYIKIENESKSILIPNKNYILLRRFSSKDDKCRLIAAPYFSNFVNSEYIGVENMVNYIYRPKGNLERNEIIGLCALLNSPLFNSFFSIFNGNVNVSATELREIPLPSIEIIKEIGDIIILSNDFSIENTNVIISNQFELSTTLNG